MKALGLLSLPLPLFFRGFLTCAVATVVLAHAPTAWSQTNCNPPCDTGQTCVQGTCMMPAPPANYPPPVYAPPPSGSQQAPQQTPPAYQGYPPPQGGAYPAPAQQPPYYAPPPQAGGYAAPPASVPPPPPQAGRGNRRGILALPFLGIHSFQGSTGNGLGAGLRLGVLVGSHVSDMLSLNGELTIDALNFKNVAAGSDVHGAEVAIAFSPLAHLPTGNLDVVAGPKLGFRAGSATGSTALGDYNSRLSGFMLGINAGIFAAISDSVSIGALATAELRSLHEVCSTSPGLTEVCSMEDRFTGPADKVISLSAGALF